MILQPHAHLQTPHYRADVDGLRALAIILVILFHFEIGHLPGGFIGVDVFFVISGYVITALIARQVADARFSFREFYLRRIRRLLPSALSVLIGALIAATLTLSTEDMQAFAKASISGLLSVANIYYYHSTNYFNSDATTKPLLHLWSLGVEEQFYLFWPALLVVLLKRSAPWVRVAALALLVIASLTAATYFHHHDAMAGFYLLPARIYEFMLGALLVFLPPMPHPFRWVLEVLYGLGLALVVAAALVITQQSPFPSYTALWPCVATAMMIYSGAHTRVSWLLRNRFAAYIGRISYQLYLVHWPVWVFVSYTSFSALTSYDKAVMLLVTVLLSMALYHTIDFPLRFGTRAEDARRRSWVFLGIALGAAALALACYSIRISGGWPWRIPPASRQFIHDPGAFHKEQFGGAGYADNQAIILGDDQAKPGLIIFGDSFAAQYAHGLDQFLKTRHQSAYAFFRNGCFIAPEATIHWRGQVNRECSIAFPQVLKLAQGNHLPVIYAQSWTAYKDTLISKTGQILTFDAASNNDYYRYLFETIDQIRERLGPRPFAIMGISPGTEDQKAVARCFRVPDILPSRCGENVRQAERLLQNGEAFNKAARQYVAEHPSVLFLNPREAVCRDGWCTSIAHGQILYSDIAHFSKAGSLHVITYFGDAIEHMLGTAKPSPSNTPAAALSP